MAQLHVGDKAPAFRLPNQDGVVTSLDDFAGRRVVVYFYAKDGAPGCTAQACQINDLLPEFATSNLGVVGISPDDVESHRKFRDRFELDINLLSDVDHAIMDAYGARDEKVRWNGRRMVGLIPSTFIIGPDGCIAAAWYDINPYSHSEEIRAALLSERQ